MDIPIFFPEWLIYDGFCESYGLSISLSVPEYFLFAAVCNRKPVDATFSLFLFYLLLQQKRCNGLGL